MNRLLATIGLALISFPAGAVVSPEVLGAPAALVILGVVVVAAVGIARYINR